MADFQHAALPDVSYLALTGNHLRLPDDSNISRVQGECNWRAEMVCHGQRLNVISNTLSNHASQALQQVDFYME